MSAFPPEARARAVEARRAAIQAGAHYRRDWADSELWDQLAKSHGLRLPQWHRPPTARALKTAARNLGNLDFQAIFGCSPSRAIKLNPKAPLRAFIGWLLEAAAEMETAAQCAQKIIEAPKACLVSRGRLELM